MARTPNYSVPALEKGLDILEALAAAVVPQSLAELAERLGRSSSALFRMLVCLERRSYVTRDPVSGKYELSLKLYALAHTHSLSDRLLRSARGPMQVLTEELRESCHLSVLEKGRLLVLTQQASPEPVRISVEPGAMFDPVKTASGRLLLSRLEPEEGRRSSRGWGESSTGSGRKALSLPWGRRSKGWRTWSFPSGTRGSVSRRRSPFRASCGRLEGRRLRRCVPGSRRQPRKSAGRSD